MSDSFAGRVYIMDLSDMKMRSSLKILLKILLNIMSNVKIRMKARY